jgi:hypothetical protein
LTIPPSGAGGRKDLAVENLLNRKQVRRHLQRSGQRFGMIAEPTPSPNLYQVDIAERLAEIPVSLTVDFDTAILR